MLYGIDISNHQGVFDLGRAASEGFAFAILKSSEGHTFTDGRFADNVANARAAGMTYAAYHYVRGGSSSAAQAAHIGRVVPTDCPVILDVETGGGGIDLTRDLTARLHAAGYRTPLLYLPAWYWQQIGSPDLSGLPPLWYSRYPYSRAGTAADVWNRHAGWLSEFWGGYGGLPVEILQYSDQGHVAGRSPVDLNAYRGARAELDALFGSSGGSAVPTKEEIMRTVDVEPLADSAGWFTVPVFAGELWKTRETFAAITFGGSGGTAEIVISNGPGSFTHAAWCTHGDGDDGKPKMGGWLAEGDCMAWGIPGDAKSVRIAYSADSADAVVGWGLLDRGD